MSSVRWLLYVTLVALPFGTRKLLFQFTPGFHEYETAFIYVSDILLVAFVVFVAVRVLRQRYAGKSQIPNPKSQINYNVQNPNSHTIVPERSRRVTIFLAPFLFLAGVSVFFAPSFGLALYSFARLLTAAAFAMAVAYVLRREIVQLRHIFGVLAASAVFQSLIALVQFIKQGSMRLWFLGEPMLSATAPGIAKFTAEGGKILRAYGTFPHPNVLGAFLVLGLIGMAYLFLRHEKFQATSTKSQINSNQQSNKPQIARLVIEIWDLFGIWMLVFGIFITMLGFVLTFSRSAWLVAIIASIALLLYCFARSELRRRALSLLFLLLAISALLFAAFRPFIFSRAHISATEPSVAQRLEYNRLGVHLIAQQPFGVGIGNQVLYSVRNGLYEKLGMTEVWQWEPIHNIYLLMASEIGIAGGLFFSIFLAMLLIPNFKYLISNLGIGYFIRNWKLGIRNFQSVTVSSDVVIARVMLVSLTVFGVVDHFLWTLRPGQLMFWLVIGILWGVRGEFQQKEKDDV